ncbi:hypothetical protein HPDP_00361 [Candidatus Hepatincola sp. Pdp]
MNLTSTININNINKYRNLKLIANTEELISLAKHINVLEINELQGILEFTKESTYILLCGEVQIKLTQECGISGEEITSNMVIPFNRKIMQQYRKRNAKSKGIDVSIIDLSLEDEEVDILLTNELNLYDTIAEVLLLEVNPFIKKEAV